MKSWPAVSVALAPPDPTSAQDAREALLVALDGAGVTAIEDREDRWVVFFQSPGERDKAARRLADIAAGLRAVAAVQPVDVPDDDWARRSQQSLTPIRVGRIVVAPPWAAPAASGGLSPSGDELTIVIQPSMGFGTGHHASTRLCLRLLQRIDPRGLALLDVGTGSGVLALAGHRLGARPVVAIDDDADALESARENLAINGASEGVELRLGDFRAMPPATRAWDVVTANLTGALLARGARDLCRAVAAGGALIVSGVTIDEEAEVLAAFAPRMTPVVRLAEQEWVGVMFR